MSERTPNYERQALYALAKDERLMDHLLSDQLEALYQENVQLRGVERKLEREIDRLCRVELENARLRAMLTRVKEITGLYLLTREIDVVLNDNSGAGLS